MDWKEFKEKYPDIYQAIFDEGKKAGTEAAETTQKNQKVQLAELNGENFEAKVVAYKSTGKSSGEAIRLAVKNYPDLHTDYVARLKTGKGETLRKEDTR